MNKTIKRWERNGLKVNVLYNTHRGWDVTVEMWVDIGPCYKVVPSLEKKWVVSGRKTLEDAVSSMEKMMSAKVVN